MALPSDELCLPILRKSHKGFPFPRFHIQHPTSNCPNNRDHLKNQSFSVDFGSGYDYLVIATGADGNEVAGVGIDNLTVVPEPAHGPLLIGGLLGLAVAVRRRSVRA